MIATALLPAMIVAAGCEEAPTAAPSPTAADTAPAPRPAPAWHHARDSAQVAVVDEAEDAELQAAIERARETADDARRRWREATEADRARWAIKWAAPVLGGGVEHVWVLPVTWTRFRIEGYLCNPPRQALMNGRDEGELVSLPAEEISDWLHDPAGPDAQREGGFTIAVLEARFGTPGGG
jgi:uncharacterized protein YegJ (DUF2314 family)